MWYPMKIGLECSRWIQFESFLFFRGQRLHRLVNRHFKMRAMFPSMRFAPQPNAAQADDLSMIAPDCFKQYLTDHLKLCKGDPKEILISGTSSMLGIRRKKLLPFLIRPAFASLC
ncbi:MAG: hypothetical protein SRB2_03089 [Desulfobacteraceae bacterium Eth-SRB2]|nr:MAG: hypothetical protein SRB2_03089 [Desulfobacteraceae bacterium Eth-SRB2]